MFLEITKTIGTLDSTIHLLQTLSSDIRIIVILLAWIMVNFIEGIAGFGTPGAIVAPLLVSLGIPPIPSIVAVLLGNSTAGAFGAVGTPTRVGLASLSTPELIIQSGLYGLVGTIIPLLIIISLSTQYKSRSKFILPAIPFALVAGFSFSFFSYLVTFIGPELPSIIGSIAAAIFLYILIKLNIFLPFNFFPSKLKSNPTTKSASFMTFLPYLLLVIALLIGKTFLAPQSYTLPIINQKISLFNPGFIFIFVSLFFIPKIGLNKLISLLHSSFTRSFDPFLVIFLVSIIVQIMILSGSNYSAYPSMINVFSQLFTHTLLPLMVPFLGAFGSFITGSITVSNILFAQTSFQAASIMNYSTTKILASQLIGASLGNSIAIADMIAAESVLGQKNQERQIIKKILPLLLISLIILAIITSIDIF